MKNIKITLAVLLLSSLAHAWSDMGHKLVGGIAEEAMGPDAKAMVRGIIGIEPLAVSAIWPDQVRDDSRFASRGDVTHDFSPFHFCEIPVGYDYNNRPRKIEKDCHSVMKYTAKLLKDPRGQRETKMIALRYLIHVVGDIHQPLHVGNGYDRGANACKVKWQKGKDGSAYTTNLHSFMDGTIVDEIRDSFANPEKKIRAPIYFGDFLKAMLDKHSDLLSAEAKKKYADGNIVSWLEESQVLRETLYPDAPGSMNNVKRGEEYKNRAYCEWYADQDRDREPAPGSKIDETKIPLLTKSYAQKHAPMIELQLFKAGIRLAGILDQIALEMKDENISRIDDAKQKSILKTVQDALRNIL